MSSSSLLPDDPSVLFTTAGMQQFKPYYTGKANPLKDFGSLNTVSIQKSIRTSDIDEVGDESHLTFFEMLGNFSFGGYWKKESIKWAHEFFTQAMGLKISYVTIFKGSNDVPRDYESQMIWQELGVTDVRAEGMADVFWGPTGSEGPCGPTTELYCQNVEGKNVEIWNIVFNEYFCNGSRERLLEGKAKLTPLATKGIDTGMGLERLAMISQNVGSNFDTNLFSAAMKILPEFVNIKTRRIMADHSRAIAFLVSDGIKPSNKDQGYILRKLMRRIIVYLRLSDLDLSLTDKIFASVINNYSEFYPELDLKLTTSEFSAENDKFTKTLAGGLRELNRIEIIDAAAAFKLYESYGLPFEIIKEIGGEKTVALTREDFDAEFKKHQEKSRAGSEKKFGGHGLLLDTGEIKASNEEEVRIVTRLHTATHLLHASLRKILGNNVKQAGSDITPERLRFDFAFSRKLTPEEIKSVEDSVNSVIKQDIAVIKEEMSYSDAIKTGALSFFKLKYPPMVNVYSVGNFSKELCGGPHVAHSGEIGEFKIIKEEAVSAGVRRIRALVR